MKRLANAARILPPHTDRSGSMSAMSEIAKQQLTYRGGELDQYTGEAAARKLLAMIKAAGYPGTGRSRTDPLIEALAAGVVALLNLELERAREAEAEN